MLFINKKRKSVQVADMLINNSLFKQDVFIFNDTTRNYCSKNRKSFNRVIRDQASEFGNVYAEEIVLTQFTNGSSHFHRRHI